MSQSRLWTRWTRIINTFMELYGYLAPVAIFLILTPSLARLFSTHNMGLFGAFVIAWFAGRKILAGLWAIAFVVIVFRVLLLPPGSSSVGDGIAQTLDSLANLALTSSYFWAMYAAIAVATVSTRIEAWTNGLEKIMNVIELVWQLPHTCHADLHVRHRGLHLRAAGKRP